MNADAVPFTISPHELALNPKALEEIAHAAVELDPGTPEGAARYLAAACAYAHSGAFVEAFEYLPALLSQDRALTFARPLHVYSLNGALGLADWSDQPLGSIYQPCLEAWFLYASILVGLGRRDQALLSLRTLGRFGTALARTTAAEMLATLIMPGDPIQDDWDDLLMFNHRTTDLRGFYAARLAEADTDWKTAAAEGDPRAQTLLAGLHVLRGEPDAAEELLTPAGELLTAARFDRLYLRLKRDPSAKAWESHTEELTRLVDASEARASYLAAERLQSSAGTGERAEERADQLRLSALGGCVAGQCEWGTALLEGKIVPRDPLYGRLWLILAADQGSVPAQERLSGLSAE